MEIERKWVCELPPAGVDLDAAPSSELRQGYVAVDGGAATEVRVRADGKGRRLTVKGGHGKVREEVELDLDEDAFARLWALTDGRRIEKRRHRVALDGGLVAEVDVYNGALSGLATVEVEFASEAASEGFSAPAWMGREVTGDRRYSNAVLASDGRP